MEMKVKPRKIKPSDLRRVAAAMVADGSMPSLETLLEAIAPTRQKYAEQLKSANTKKRKPVSRPKARLGWPVR
jgi:hypothetical protein